VTEVISPTFFHDESFVTHPQCFHFLITSFQYQTTSNQTPYSVHDAMGGCKIGGRSRQQCPPHAIAAVYHFRRCPFLQNNASLRCICHAAFIMTATDDTPMLVESPLQPASDPEWDLHFAVRPLPLQPRLQSTPLPPNFSVTALYSQAPYAQLVLGSAAHALQVHARAPFKPMPIAAVA